MKEVTFESYQDFVKSLAVYPDSARIMYPCLGLAGEVGEVCEKVKKHIRDGRVLDKEDLTKELGDVLWYLSAVALDLGISLKDVAETNITKLTSRKERGVIHGSGDNR